MKFDFFSLCSCERKFVQDLRQQQDEAYELSLRADQEKERLKQLERERLLQQEMQEEAERLEKQRQKEVKFNNSICFCEILRFNIQILRFIFFFFLFFVNVLNRISLVKRSNVQWKCQVNRILMTLTPYCCYSFYQMEHDLNVDSVAQIC